MAVLLALLLTVALLPPAAIWAQHQDLQSPEARRRARAAQQLGRSKDSRQIAALRPLLQDPERQVRVEAVAAIVEIGTQHSLEPLIEATRDSEPAIQILAVDGLVNFYSPGYVQRGWTSTLRRFGTNLRSRFTDTNTLVIDPYIQVAPDVVEAIGRVASGGTSMDSRALACRAVGILRGRAAIPHVLEALRSKNDAVMLEGLRALEKIGDRSAAPELAFLLRDLNENVQIAAISATGQLQNREAIPTLQEILKTSPRPKVRQAALIALAKLPEASSKPLFYQYLDDRDRYLRAAAAEGVGRSGDASDLEKLRRAFSAERSESPRLSLAFALVKLGDHSYLNYLLDGLNSTFHRGEARPFLVEVARDERVLSQLYGPLTRGSKDQRKELAYVVATSGTEASAPYLEKLSHDSDPEVAQEAIRAFKSLKARL
jgi:HEAT repeat protein